MSRTTDTDNATIREHYPSFKEASEYMLAPITSSPADRCRQWAQRLRLDQYFGTGDDPVGPGFSQGSTVLSTIHDVLHGRCGGAADAAVPLIAQLNARVPAQLAVWRQSRPRRVRMRAAVGDELHITEAMQGRHDTAWSTTTRREQDAFGRPRFATVFINAGIRASESARRMVWRVAATMVVVDRLEAANIRTEVVVGSVGIRRFPHDGRAYEMTITAKPHDMPASLEQIAVLGSAGFARTCLWTLYAANSVGAALSEGIGLSESRLPKYVTDRRAQGHLVVDIDRECMSLDAAARVVTDCMHALTKPAIAA